MKETQLNSFDVINGYVLWNFPARFLSKRDAEYSKKEAKEYCEWLIGVRVYRISQLYSYFDRRYSTFEPMELDDLVYLNNCLVSEILEGEYYSRVSDDRIQLNAMAHSFAVDMGLAFQEYMVRKYEELTIGVSSVTAKRGVLYNKTVLKGLKSEIHEYDMFSAGLAEIYDQVLKGKPNDDAWPNFKKTIEQLIDNPNFALDLLAEIEGKKRKK